MTVNVGGFGARDAVASASMMRLIADSTASRTCASNVRTFSRSSASSGMMWGLRHEIYVTASVVGACA